jgi:dephospho-CoA kinase
MAPNHSNPGSTQTDLASLKGMLPLIGLTGGIGSGKTAVSDQLRLLGAGVVDTDLIAHQITAPGGSAILAIEKVFGSDFIHSDGSLNRSKMRSLVFEDPQSRRLLEEITHPLIKIETAKQALAISKTGVPYLLFVVPLLIESGSWRSLIDYLVVVDCPEETQIARVMHRNNMGRSEVENILKAQASRESRLAAADAVIENQNTLESLEPEVLSLHQKLLKIGKAPSSSS